MKRAIIPMILLISMTPVFAQTTNCNTNNAYYANPQPSTSLLKDFVNTFFNKLCLATGQLGGQNANQMQNVTSSIQTVVDTGIDYVGAIKYLVASLLGIIVPRLFGVDVPSWLLPAIEWGTIAIVIYAVWKKAWTIFVISLIVGIVILLVFYFGGVFFH